MNGGDVAAAAPAPPLEWKFSQVFGERAAGEEVQEGHVSVRQAAQRAILLGYRRRWSR